MTPTRPLTLSAVVAVVAGVALAGPAAAAPTAIAGTLLPVPTVPGGSVSVTAVDVNPLGVVAGNAQIVVDNPDGTQAYSTTAHRWAPIPRFGWQRQQLSAPAGSRQTTVTGLTNLGEPAGQYEVGGAQRAVRWSILGTSATEIGGAGSATTAVGPNGPWGVSVPSPLNPIVGGAELVARDGTRRPVAGTPELDNGYRRTIVSVGGPDAALVGVTNGVGGGTRFSPVLWVAGRTLGLPVFNSPLGVQYCASEVRADGSFAYSGIDVSGGTPTAIMVRHTGGVPGTDVQLDRAPLGSPAASALDCAGGFGQTDTLAADGGIAGVLSANDGRRQAAYWDAANRRTLVPLAADEAASSAVAVATGKRMVIRSVVRDAGERLSFWHDGVVTPLTVPAGWFIRDVVELTDRGILVVNLTDTIGRQRPIAWNLSGR